VIYKVVFSFLGNDFGSWERILGIFFLMIAAKLKLSSS